MGCSCHHVCMVMLSTRLEGCTRNQTVAAFAEGLGTRREPLLCTVMLGMGMPICNPALRSACYERLI